MSSINITTNKKHVFATDWYLIKFWSNLIISFLALWFWSLKPIQNHLWSDMTIWPYIIQTNFEEFKFRNRTLSLIRHLRPAIYKSWFFLKTLGENSELEILARGTNGAFNASQIGKIDLFSLFSDICIF